MKKMSVNMFEMLPVNVFFEIFLYLSASDALQSFGALDKYFSRIVIRDNLWHISLDDPNDIFTDVQ